MSGYEAVMRLARDPEVKVQPAFFGKEIDWLAVVRACYEEAERLGGERFAGAWIVDKVGWFPGLKKLERYGVLKKEGETVRGGRRAYWTMPDREGVARALRELGYL